jgi:hypothetical protein
MPPRTLRVVAVALSTVCVALAAAASAGAVPMTRTFSSVGGMQTFDVPGGVTSIDVEAVGAKGGSGGGGAAGGFGGRVTGRLAVTPGQRLWIAVGGNGPGAGCPASGGGWNGGGAGGTNNCVYRGGTGGGASDLRVCAPGDAACVADDPLGRLLVAGGGGGGGGNQYSANGDSGAGGSAAAPGTTVSSNRGTAGGGGAGADGAGGAPGARGDTGHAEEPLPAEPGVLGAGGSGGTGQVGGLQGGGGGGGGRYGGGGGGSASYYAGGGGGGSNLVPQGGTASTDATGSPKVALTWAVGPPATIDRPMLAAPAVYADGAATTTVTVVARDADGAPVTGGEVTFSSTAAHPLIGATTDHGDGSYSATVTAASERGTTTITAQLASPAQTSDGVTLKQVVHPLVTTPADGTPVLDRLTGPGAVTISGTADPLTESVDVGCVTGWGFMLLGGVAAGVPVTDGTWTVADAPLLETWTTTSHCRLVAVPTAMPADGVDTLPGPRLRRLTVSTDGAGDGTGARMYVGTASGIAGEADMRALGYGCGVVLRAVDAAFAASPNWLACGAELAFGRSIGAEADLVIDGRPAFTAGLAYPRLAAAANAPRATVSTSVASDRSLVVTERGAAARCTATAELPADAADCGPLADTGITVTVRTQLSPSGTQVLRALVFESSDGQAHDVRVVLRTRSGYRAPEFRFGDEAAWTPRIASEPVAAASDRYSVLVRDGSNLARPAMAVTSMPSPSEQVVANSRISQRYVRTVPAGGVAGVGIAFDLVDGATVESAAAAARAAYDVGITVDGPAEGTTTDAATATVTGTVLGGAGPLDLRLDGEPVAVGDGGRWSATVPLAPGENRLEAEVVSPFGPRDAKSVTITRVLPPDPPEPPTPTTPTTPATPTTPTTPTTPATPEPPAPALPHVPGTAPLPPHLRLLERLTAPRRVRLAQARTRGLTLFITLGAERSRVSAELRGPWGGFARLVSGSAKRGPLVLRLTPSRRAAAKAARALKGRKAVDLGLKLTVRTPSGASRTVTKTIRLVR